MIKKWWSRFRSAITGRFVSKSYAEQHKDTTVSERIKDEVREPVKSSD